MAGGVDLITVSQLTSKTTLKDPGLFCWELNLTLYHHHHLPGPPASCKEEVWEGVCLDSFPHMVVDQCAHQRHSCDVWRGEVFTVASFLQGNHLLSLSLSLFFKESYWVGQKVCSGFPETSYKNLNELFGQPAM